jgi:hypothetical protein
MRKDKAMSKTNRLVILMTESEREAIERLAKAEKLPASTFARRRLLLEADQRGLVFSRNETSNAAMA